MASRQPEVEQRPMFPPWGSITITPSDSTVLSPICSRLYIGGAGAVKVRLLDGSTPTFSAVPVGTMLEMQFDQVFATGTAATLMVGLFR